MGVVTYLCSCYKVFFLRLEASSCHKCFFLTNDIKGHKLKRQLKAMFENFGLIFLILCYVKDEGINLVNMTSTLTLIISCEALSFYNPFDGACFQHAMNKATQDVTNDDKISKDSAN